MSTNRMRIWMFQCYPGSTSGVTKGTSSLALLRQRAAHIAAVLDLAGSALLHDVSALHTCMSLL